MTSEFKIGDKVRATEKIIKRHELYPDYYPNPGVTGTVVDGDTLDVFIQWESGSTSGDDKWHCQCEFLERIENNGRKQNKQGNA